MNSLLRSRLFGLTLCTSALGLAACGTTRECVDPDSPYLRAESRPTLHMPEGSTAPDRTGMLVIPDATAGAPAPMIKDKKTGSCLDEPPPYYGPSGGTGTPSTAPATPPVLPPTRAPLPPRSGSATPGSSQPDSTQSVPPAADASPEGTK